MSSAAALDTAHPAIARIRSYFSACHAGSSHDYAALVRGRCARLRADGSRLDEVLASYRVVRLVDAAGVAQTATAGSWKVAVCLSGR